MTAAPLSAGEFSARLVLRGVDVTVAAIAARAAEVDDLDELERLADGDPVLAVALGDVMGDR